MRSYAGRVTPIVTFAVLLAGASAPAQSFPDSVSRRAPAALDVPYISQSVLLCGGAALAMVERWWGRRGVFAEDFANLVRPRQGGIVTTDLAAAARARGWETLTFDGTPERVRRSLADSVPVIALIQVGRKRYHYVVILEWAAGRVIYHDPARTPSRSVTEAAFEKQWAGADRWAMVVRPNRAADPTGAPPAGPPPSTGSAAPVSPAARDTSRCGVLLNEGIDAATAGRLDEAAQLITDARAQCPTLIVTDRELAGVRFRQRRYADAALLADRYTQRVPADSLAWRLLASSLFLGGNADDALDAWNRIGMPATDLIRIDGAHVTRFRTLVDAMQLPPRSLLTRSRLIMARRRLADIPSVSSSAVRYQPEPGDLAEIHAAVNERPMFGRPWMLVARGAIDAVVQQQVHLDVTNPVGIGDVWSVLYRWQEPRARAAGRLDVPIGGVLPFIVGVETAWDRYRFAPVALPATPYLESRRSTMLTAGAWLVPFLRVTLGARQERWSESRDYMVALSGVELRALHDRLIVQLNADHGFATGSTSPYSHGSARAVWASALGLATTVWSARVGVDASSAAAPLGTWANAGSNFAYAIGLRAHPGVIGDGLDPALVGRTLLHGGVSGDHPLYRAGPFVLAAGLFVDGARVADPANGAATQKVYIDAGGGLRVGVADGRLGVIRFDLATGLTDRSTAITVGVHQTWPLAR